jgi:ATP-binding cassette, subfamily B, bacterial
VIVLDEPTSMMDPLREQRTFERLLNELSNQTVVFVSHRMGFARFVDKVVVVDQGRMIQCGRHEDLIQQSGRYRELYEAQAQWYREDEKDV